MDLKILMLLLVYWVLWLSILYFAGGSLIEYNTSASLNNSGLDSAEVDTGGNFVTGVSFGRFVGMAAFGIGLPSSTPSWFKWIFAAWQSIVTILTAGFIMSSLWNG